MSNNDNNNNNQNVKRTSTDTSYTVFASVDARVAKPVLGSDGAAAWQNFRQQTTSNKAASAASSSRKSVAPKAPLKALDRAVGYTSWHQERQNEERVRAQDGERAVNAGYTHFAKKNNSSITEKERKRIQQRLIGEDQDYFLPFKTWQGPKWDYVFTTKQSHGTGYFFDGMDSLKRLLQEDEQQPIVDSRGAEPAASSSATATAPTPTGPLDKPIKKQKSATSPVTTQSDGKKRKKTKAATSNTVIIQSDPTNPLQQVAAALQARQQQHQQQQAWEQAVDSASGKPYYYNRVTGERSWEPPLPTGWHQASDPETGKPYYFHKDTGVVVWERPS